MAGQKVLLPTNASLFMVDRSWMRQPKRTAHGQNEFQLPKNGLENDIKFTVLNENSPRPSGKHGQANKRGVEFVNSTPSKFGREDDENLRRLIRSHVMTGTKRQSIRLMKGRKNSKILETTDAKSAIEGEFEDDMRQQKADSLSPDWTLVCSGSSTPLYGASNIKIQPYFYKFMNFYLHQQSHLMYPLDVYFSYNPVKAHWFPLAITDEALLHTIMFSAATELSLSDVKNESYAPDQLVGPIFRLLMSRMQNKTQFSDATIGAVSCLAMCENRLGNWERWQLHMAGLKNMIEARGGIWSIATTLQMKIMRADIDGAVDHLSLPCLPHLEKISPSLYTRLPQEARKPPSEAILNIIASTAIQPQLKTTLIEISQFSIAVQYYTSYETFLIDPRAFDEDVLSIQRNLLAILTNKGTDLEQALCTGSLIFMKCITRNLRPKTGSRKLGVRLKHALSGPSKHISAALFLWLSFMGGIASSSGNEERMWFLDSLSMFIYQEERLQTWEDIKLVLKSVMWIDVVHEKPCKRIWEEFQ